MVVSGATGLLVVNELFVLENYKYRPVLDPQCSLCKDEVIALLSSPFFILPLLPPSYLFWPTFLIRLSQKICPLSINMVN